MGAAGVLTSTRMSPPSEAAGPAEACEISSDESEVLLTIRGPGGTSVRHPNLGFSFSLPSQGFRPEQEERPLMSSALRSDERTVSHPFFDDFSRSFLVVRITKLDAASSLGQHVRVVETEIEAGAKKELGARTSLTPWLRSEVASRAVFDERLFVEIRGWPVGVPKGGCSLAVVLIGVSIDPSEMPSVMDSFEL